MKDAAGRINIDLDPNEALVLLEFLWRTNNARAFDSLIVDQAEQRVLWNIENMLEKVLFLAAAAPDYNERVAAARDAVRDVEF